MAENTLPGKERCRSCLFVVHLDGTWFLSGPNEAQLALVKLKVEQHVSPKITEARAITLKAAKEADASW